MESTNRLTVPIDCHLVLRYHPGTCGPRNVELISNLNETSDVSLACSMGLTRMARILIHRPVQSLHATHTFGSPSGVACPFVSVSTLAIAIPCYILILPDHLTAYHAKMTPISILIQAPDFLSHSVSQPKPCHSCLHFYARTC